MVKIMHKVEVRGIDPEKGTVNWNPAITVDVDKGDALKMMEVFNRSGFAVVVHPGHIEKEEEVKPDGGEVDGRKVEAVVQDTELF